MCKIRDSLGFYIFFLVGPRNGAEYSMHGKAGGLHVLTFQVLFSFLAVSVKPFVSTFCFILLFNIRTQIFLWSPFCSVIF